MSEARGREGEREAAMKGDGGEDTPPPLFCPAKTQRRVRSEG